MKKILLAIVMASSLVSARAAIFQYVVNFAPVPGGATGSGTGTVNYDDVTHSLQIQASFSGLSGTTTASHIHSPTAVPFSGTAGVATTTPSFTGFPLGVTSGTFSSTLDLSLASSWNGAYVTANGGTTATAEAAFVSQIAAGKAYWNIHSSTFGGGEINGFLTAVPEPSSLALAGLGIVGMTTRFWRQRRGNQL